MTKQELKHEPNPEKLNTPAATPPSVQGGLNQPGEKDPGKKMTLGDLEQEPIIKKFSELFKKNAPENLTYHPSQKDLIAYMDLPRFNLTESQMDAALVEFFNPTGWPMNKKALKFFIFAKDPQQYFLLSTAPIAPTVSKDDLGRYYEPWDPRNPWYDENDPVQKQQKKNHLATYGPWTPKPDWSQRKR